MFGINKSSAIESAKSLLDASVSMGLNISRVSRRIGDGPSIASDCVPVRMSYGSYCGGDVSIGGGEPLSLDRWIAEPESIPLATD